MPKVTKKHLRMLASRQRRNYTPSSAYVDTNSREERIRELKNKIVAVCVTCPQAKGKGTAWQCQVSPRRCHSKKVRRWLKELEDLEGTSS